MLPFEAHLMAAGWPKNGTDEEGNEVVREGSRPARLLHMVRRAERNLMSYERTGTSSSCQYCVSKPGCLMRHIWLHTPDCKASNGQIVLTEGVHAS